MKFSIVIPLFNEAENVLKLNSEIIEVLSGLKSTINEFEIIYVDDSSTDNTLKILNEINNNISTKIIKNNSNLAQSKIDFKWNRGFSFNNMVLQTGILNDPKDIVKMIDVYNKNENSLVHGFRKIEATCTSVKFKVK